MYALLRDGASWPSWSPIESFELERPGTDEPEGVGAVRLFRGGRVVGHDEIVELVPDRRFSYAHTSNLPVRDYRGDVDLEPAGGQTAIRWVSQFNPKVPGTGRLLRRGLDGFVAKMVNGLAERATALAEGRRTPAWSRRAPGRRRSAGRLEVRAAARGPFLPLTIPGRPFGPKIWSFV